jgi:hypothetical protein
MLKAAFVLAFCSAVVFGETVRWKPKFPCKPKGSSGIFQCALVKEANSATMNLYINHGRGGYPGEEKSPLGVKMKKPFFKDICTKESERQVYYYNCYGHCGDCCMEKEALDEDRPIWATYGHWANGKAKCMGKERPKSPYYAPSKTLKLRRHFLRRLSSSSSIEGYMCKPISVGPKGKPKYDKEDKAFEVVDQTGGMRTHECYNKCIEEAKKLEEVDPFGEKGNGFCCQYFKETIRKLQDKTKVLREDATCTGYKYDSFESYAISSDRTPEMTIDGKKQYVLRDKYMSARAVPKGYNQENLKYLLDKPTRWDFLPGYRERFFD